MTKTGSVGRSIRVGGKLILVAGASMLMAMACGTEEEGPSGDGDGDGDMVGSGGTVIGGTGGTTTGTGGSIIGGTGGSVAGTGGSSVVAPTMPGAAVATPIPAGTFAVDAMGFGTDATNGFQGFAFTYTDMNGSVIYPANFGTTSETEVAEGKLCANGTGAQVLDMMYSTYWGAGLGWNLNQAADEADTTPVSVAAFTGVTFTLVQAVPAQTRIVVNVGTTGYCKTIAAGENTVLWTELNTECWADPPTGEFFDPTDPAALVNNISFQIPTNTAAPTPFDFCVGGLTFNGGDGMGGAPAL